MSLHTRTIAMISGCLLLLATGCGRFSSGGDADQDFQHARKAADAGDVRVAAALYEKGLRTAPESARPHLELGLLYDEKLGDPITAIYHYQQYLELEPNSDRRQIVEGYIARAKLTLAAKLPPAPATDPTELLRVQTEKTALMQENAALRARVAELEHTAPPSGADAVAVMPAPAPVVVSPPAVVAPTAARTHLVQRGDTLQSLALRYYGTRSSWEKIYAANRAILPNKNQLKVGQQLLIP